MDNPQMTVAQLITQLQKVTDQSRIVQVWLPGSRIDLASVAPSADDAVLIEGNVQPGSALFDIVTR